MTDALTDMEEQNVLAGELALRVLSPVDEVQARARAASDPAFAAEVEAWNERLVAFIDEIPAVEPSPRVWARLQAAVAETANDNGRLAFWRNWAIGSTGLLAASLAAVAIMIAQPDPVAPPAPAAPAGVTRVATLSLENGAPVVTLAYDTATGNLFLSPTPRLAGEDGVPHLWLVLPDDAGVQLVGAIEDGQASRLNLTQALAGSAGQPVAMAISIEAPGHVPAPNKPDGPVVASGELQRL